MSTLEKDHADHEKEGAYVYAHTRMSVHASWTLSPLPYLSWYQLASQAEAASTHGLLIEARTLASLFKPHLQEDLKGTQGVRLSQSAMR